MDGLAIFGGKPTRTNPFPKWPIFDDKERSLLLEALTSRNWGQSLGLGPKAEEFAERFATFCGVRHAIPVSNCTSALVLALQAVGIGPEDEVIVPALTFAATAFAPLLVGASVRFVDIDPATLCIDPQAAENAITGRTGAILPVHLGGTPADMRSLKERARKRKIHLIEDCAQAHGASLDEVPVGAWGVAGCFSFHATKNIACGEGGIITTNDEGLAELCGYELCKFGRRKNGHLHLHHRVAGNYGITEFQAAVLLAQLDRNSLLSQRRKSNAKYLRRQLAQFEGLTCAELTSGTTSCANHIFFIKYDRTKFADCPRELFISALNAEGIPVRTLYPTPLYHQPALARRVWPTADEAPPGSCYVEPCPHAERISVDELIALPQTVLIGDQCDIDSVVTAIGKIRTNLPEAVGWLRRLNNSERLYPTFVS